MTALDQVTVQVAFGDDPHTVSKTWITLAGVRGVNTRTSSKTRRADSFIAGGATIVADASDREYDPTYSGSTYAGGFNWGTPVRVYDATTRYLFQGYAIRFTPNPGTHDSVTVIECTDGIGLAAETRLAAITAAHGGDTAADRIGRVLDATNWPTADRTLDASSSSLAATTYGVTALAEMVNAARSAGGFVYHSPTDNDMHFEDRTAIATRSRMGTTQETFGTAGLGIIESTLIVPGVGDGFRNVVRITDAAGTVHTAGTVAATAVERSIDRATTSAPPNAAALADWLLDLWDTEYPAPASWQVFVAGGDSGVNLSVMDTRLRDRVTVAYDPVGTGTESLEVIVNAITHKVTPSEWVTKFEAEPADAYDNTAGPPSTWMIWDTDDWDTPATWSY